MFKIVKTQTRPSTNVEFWTNQNVTAETWAYLFNTHHANVVNIETDISEDSLTLTKTTVWNSREDYDAFLSDDTVINNVLNVSRAYMEENGITFTTGTE